MAKRKGRSTKQKSLAKVSKGRMNRAGQVKILASPLAIRMGGSGRG